MFLVRARDSDLDSTTSTPDLIADKTEVQAPDDVNPKTPEPPDHIDHSNSAKSNIPTLHHNTPHGVVPPPSIFIPTRLNSPTANEQLRRNPFGRSRLVTRGGLVRCLEAETDRVRGMDPAERIMREEPGYAEYEARLRQTLERLNEASDEDIGVLHPFRIFLFGLIGVLNYKDQVRITTNSTRSNRRRMHATPPAVRSPSPRLPAPTVESSAEPEPPIAPEAPATPRPSSNPPAYNDDPSIPQCPSRPRNAQDPRSVWIGDRAYYPGGANNYVRESTPIEGHVFVHIHKGCIVTDTRGIHPESLETYSKLGGPLSTLYWPGCIHQSDPFSLAIPPSTASDYTMRFREMYFQRKEYEILIHRSSQLLTSEQRAECSNPYIYLYQARAEPNSQMLVRLRLDRAYVLMRINPIWNPYLRPIEASFLRSAYYKLLHGKHRLYAEHIDRVLRTPSWDDWEIREMLCLGMFETEDRTADALRYFEQVDQSHWDFHESEATAPRTYEGTIIYMQTDPEDTDSDSDMSDVRDQAAEEEQRSRNRAERSFHATETPPTQRLNPDLIHPSW